MSEASSTVGSAPRSFTQRRQAADYARRRYKRIQTGQWAPFTETTSVREHLAALRNAGLTLDQISHAGGVSVSTLLRTDKALRMTSAAAAAILTVPVPSPAAGPAPRACVAAQLRSLVADGWTLVQIAKHAGLSERAVYQQINEQVTPSRATIEAIRTAYDTLLLEDAGDNPPAVRARARAARAGWHPSTPPPAEDLDDVAVARAVAGEPVTLQPADRDAVMARLGGHVADSEIARRLDVSPRTVLRWRTQHGLPSYAGK